MAFGGYLLNRFSMHTLHCTLLGSLNPSSWLPKLSKRVLHIFKWNEFTVSLEHRAILHLTLRIPPQHKLKHLFIKPELFPAYARGESYPSINSASLSFSPFHTVKGVRLSDPKLLLWCELEAILFSKIYRTPTFYLSEHLIQFGGKSALTLKKQFVRRE